MFILQNTTKVYIFYTGRRKPPTFNSAKALRFKTEAAAQKYLEATRLERYQIKKI